MEHEAFLKLAAEKVAEMVSCSKEEVFCVWSCKTLKNSKAIMSAKPKGAPLFEITMDGTNGAIYIDKYQKMEQRKIFFKPK